MQRFKKLGLFIWLALMGVGILLLGAWDMQHGEAAPIPEGWMLAAAPPEALVGNTVQCPDQPESIFIVGGINPEGTGSSDRLFRYDAGTDSWEEKVHLPIPLRAMAVACYQGRIFVAGSWDLPSNLLFIYSISDDSWYQGANLPDPVGGAIMGAWDGKLYLAGGSRILAPFTPLARVDVYDIATDTWTAGGGAIMPTPSSYLGGYQRGPYLFAVGGYSGNPNNNVDQTQRYNMATNTWEVGPTFTSQRSLANLSMTDSFLYAQGGDRNGGGFYDKTDLVEVLDLSVWPGGSWTNLEDPLPEPSFASPGGCTEGRSGGEIWAIGGLDDAWIPYDDIYYRPSEPCVSFGIDLHEPIQGEGAAGETVTYTLSITNTGVVTDYFTLEVSTTWTINTPLGGLGPIGPWESLPIKITVGIPTDAMWGDVGITEITAASISNPAALDNTSITTRVLGYEFNLQAIPPDNQQGPPGDVLTYTLQVTNIGDFADNYTVTISATWETSNPIAVGPLLPAEDDELVVNVQIPLEAKLGDWDYAVLTLTSQAVQSVSHTVKLTSTAVWFRTLLPLTLKN